MTDKEYLQILNVLEGSGDKWGKTKTSSKYGITDNGINRITRNMITKDAKGNYTPHAIKIQNMFSPALRKVLLDNATWKDGTLKKQASLEQVGKCKDAWDEMALAIREVNKEAIRREQTIPLTDDMQERLCLSAHNREGVIKSKVMKEAIASGNNDVVRHTAMNYLENVDAAVLPGIRRRQAAIFHPTMGILEAWRHFDKDGRENIGLLVDDAYAKDAIEHEQRLKNQSASQAVASRWQQTDNTKIRTGAKPLPNEKQFISDLLGNNSLSKYAKTQDNASKTPQDKGLLGSAIDVAKGFINRLTGQSNQVAENQENVLNNNQEA